MEQSLLNVLEVLRDNLYFIQVAIVIITTFVIFSIILRGVKRFLLQKVKSKRQLSNITVFLQLLKYLFIFFMILVVVFSFYNSWSQLGFVAGLLSVALGLALQKPISGVFAWLVIVTRRPFGIGDRITISNIKGDVKEISLTHIFLNEIGGTVEGEEASGRTVMIPTSTIFEEEIINYTEKDEYILDEVTSTVTYESNLEKAESIVLDAVKEIMKPLWDKFPKKISQEPHTRLLFKESGIDITVRYYTVVNTRNAISTNIRRVIHQLVISADDVEFAYPHAEVLLRDKNK